MNPRIRLHEWTRSAPLALSEGSLRTLSALGHLLEMRPDGRRWTLRSKGIVGRVQLHEGTLELLPKHPVANLCRMIAAVAGVPRLFEPITTLGDGGLPDLLVAAFVQRAEGLLAEGLRRDYVERREQLAVLRGRLDLPAHLRRPEALVTDLSCRHEDYTLDTPFNAVLRQTAEACHSRWPALAERVLRLRHRLAGVPRTRLRPDEIDRFRYDRLTESYRPVHALCRAILAGTRLGLGGEHEAPGASFVVEMAPLFERFVSLSLRARTHPPWRVALQERVALDRAGALEIRPDVVVYREHQPMAVVDAKYKLRRGGVPKISDAYQVLAYARRYGLERAWLIYPDRPAGERRLVTHDGTTEIISVGLDLEAAWAEVEAALDRLATSACAVA
jgi:5-methylcytosine-specific restriction enzyme subunit McrC